LAAVKNGDRTSRGLWHIVRSIFTVGGAIRLLLQYVVGFMRFWQSGRGISCAQRLALPMGLNRPFLWRVLRHVCITTCEKNSEYRQEMVLRSNRPR